MGILYVDLQDLCTNIYISCGYFVSRTFEDISDLFNIALHLCLKDNKEPIRLIFKTDISRSFLCTAVAINIRTTMVQL
jgi:hypothetical protein